MAIFDEIGRISDAKKAIREAIISKGVDVPEDMLINEYPEKINEISGSGTAWSGFNMLLTGADGSVHVPAEALQGVATPPPNVLTGMKSVGSVDIPEGITSLTQYEFSGTNITDFYLPDSCVRVSNNSLSSLSLHSISFGRNCSYIDVVGVNVSSYNFSRIEVPCEIRSNALNGTSCSEINLENIRRVNLNSVLDYGTIYNNQKLEVFTFGKAVKEIITYGYTIFKNCPMLTHVVFEAPEVPNFVNSTAPEKWFNNVGPDVRIMVPSGSIDIYKNNQAFAEVQDLIEGF